MIALIIIGIALVWFIESTLMDRARYMDEMQEKENTQSNYVNNYYNGNVDNVNDNFNFPAEKIIDVEVVEK